MPDQNDRLADIMMMLGRLEAKVDAAITTRTEDREVVTRLECRVRKLEKSWAYVTGISAAVATAAGYITSHGLKF